MPKKQAYDPKAKFQEGIERIRRSFPAVFNSRGEKKKWVKSMGDLFWEDAALVLTGSRRVVRGRRRISDYWWDIKHKKTGRRLKSLDCRSPKPAQFPVFLIGVVAKGEYNFYDIGAYDFCKFHFNPDGTDIAMVIGYFHKRTCTTAVREMIIDDAS
jgi:hypothetical protein